MSEDWPRIIVHADMDAFYAAVEQLDDPRLRGRPLLVGSDAARGVVLTASYEARSSGAGSAMPMHKARRLCPDALIVPPRFERYQEVSALVMEALGGFSPLQSATLSRVAARLGATPLQVALAWLLQRSPNILLIPGTSSVAHLKENLAAARVQLSAEDVAELER